MKYLLSGLEFNSEEALKMNIVQEVVKPDEVFSRAKDIATSIAAAAPLAVKETIKSAKIALEKEERRLYQNLIPFRKCLHPVMMLKKA